MTLFIVTWSRSAPSWLARKIPPQWSCAVSALPCNSRPRSLMALVRSYFFLIHLCFLYAIYFTCIEIHESRATSALECNLTIINDTLPTSNKVLYMWHTSIIIKITLLIWKVAFSQCLLNTRLLNLVKPKNFGRSRKNYRKFQWWKLVFKYWRV